MGVRKTNMDVRSKTFLLTLGGAIAIDQAVKHFRQARKEEDNDKKVIDYIVALAYVKALVFVMLAAGPVWRAYK